MALWTLSKILQSAAIVQHRNAAPALYAVVRYVVPVGQSHHFSVTRFSEDHSQDLDEMGSSNVSNGVGAPFMKITFETTANL